MSRRFTAADIAAINARRTGERSQALDLTGQQRTPKPRTPKPSPVVGDDTLSRQLAEYGIPRPVAEFMFHPTRKWRFDYCWEIERIAVEIEGGAWSQGRHTRGKGYIADMEKYNEAQRLGYRVYRFTPQQITDGTARDFLRRVFAVLYREEAP